MYAQLDSNGKIVGLFNMPQAFDTTVIADDDSRIADFYASQSAPSLIKQAQAALAATDAVAIRCIKAGVAFNSEWQTYVTALRSVVAGTSTTLPTKPTTYPQGS